MIKHKHIQKRFKALHKNRMYSAHTSKISEEQQLSNLNANLNICERMNNNYFGERRELE